MDLHALDPDEAAKSEGRPSDNSVDRLRWPRLRVTMFAVIWHCLCSELTVYTYLMVSSSYPGQMWQIEDGSAGLSLFLLEQNCLYPFLPVTSFPVKYWNPSKPSSPFSEEKWRIMVSFYFILIFLKLFLFFYFPALSILLECTVTFCAFCYLKLTVYAHTVVFDFALWGSY